jgi:hypothetical protein
LGAPFLKLQFSWAKMQNLNVKNRKTQAIKRKTREWDPKANAWALGTKFHSFFAFSLKFLLYYCIYGRNLRNKKGRER